MTLPTVRLKTKPVEQEDGHTCGYCALASIYRLYGLDPDAMDLRAYLGTDNILPYRFPYRARIEEWLGGTDHFAAGTLPFDMLAVLYWDGFDTTLLPGPYLPQQERLAEHLESGEPALAFVYSCWHWVVVSGISPRGVRITDGYLWDHQRGRTYVMSHAEFQRECHGMILVSQAEEEGRSMTYLDFARQYSRGIAFSAAMLGKKIPTGIRRRMVGR